MTRPIVPRPITSSRIMPLNKRNHSSILPDQPLESFEIQGYYWPRILLRDGDKKRGKKEDKKALKAMKKRAKPSFQNRSTFHVKPLHFETGTPSLLDLLCDIPCLVSEDQPHRSPITGRPILPAVKRTSCLVPPRKQRRCQSNVTTATVDC